MPHSVPDYNYKPNTPILYLEITDQFLVTDNGFLEKPIKDQGRRDQLKIYQINYPHVTQSIAHTSQFSPTD